jgi:hypothetical protein
MVGGQGVIGRNTSTRKENDGLEGLEGRGVVGWAVLKVLLE